MLRKTVEGYPYQEFIYCHCNCGFTRPKSYDKDRPGIYIGRHCVKGRRAHNYKGGYIDASGYRRIRRVGHPFADKKGYVREHRAIFEDHYQCILLPWGTVHHKDGNTLNNDIKNLEGMMNYQHTIRHNKVDFSDRVCLLCGGTTTFIHKRNNSQNWYRYQNGWICSFCRDKLRRMKKKK